MSCFRCWDSGSLNFRWGPEKDEEDAVSSRLKSSASACIEQQCEDCFTTGTGTYSFYCLIAQKEYSFNCERLFSQHGLFFQERCLCSWWKSTRCCSGSTGSDVPAIDKRNSRSNSHNHSNPYQAENQYSSFLCRRSS